MLELHQMTVDDSAPAIHLRLSATEAPDSLCSASATNHGVHIGDQYATFNGRNAWLEIPHPSELQLGTNDFSIAVQIWTAKDLDDVVGDIVSQFDPVNRRGFSLTVKHHAGAVTSQTNYRNLHFEADDATKPQWHDCGRLGNALSIWSLAVYDGRLYAGTYEGGANECGRVFRYAGGQQWECCGPLDGSSSASALAVFDGHLYVATKTEDPHGSLLDPTSNKSPGGSVFRLNDDESWTYCGKVCEQDNIFGLSVYRGRLYAWPAYSKGIYVYESDTNWRRIPSPDSRLLAMAPFHGDLYAAANRLALLDPNVTHAGPHGDPNVQAIVGKDGVFRMSPDGEWVGCGNQGQETQMYSIAVHAGEMYVGTWPSGKVFRYQGGKEWHDCGRLGNEDEVMGLAVYNGMLYAGSLPSAAIFRFDGDQCWTSVGRVDYTPNAPLRRAVNMAVYEGRMCVGTLPSGRVWAMEVGQVASHDRQMPHGWRHIAAVRRRGQLHLYIDGKCVAASRALPQPLNLTNGLPLCVGFGRHDYFNGRMRDFRLYSRALSEPEITKLSETCSIVQSEVPA